MKYFSTKDRSLKIDLKTVVTTGMPSDGGLYMPVDIPQISSYVLSEFQNMPINDIAKVVLHDFIVDDLNQSDFEVVVDEALNFNIPLKKITDNISVLELFHGPTLAFKDVGARFMSRLLSKLIKNDKQMINIVVATSGDTGSAVASGFYNVDGIRVFILYPSKKISDIQKKQITTYGNNIYPLEIEGNFDDCQRIVKRLLSDQQIHEMHRITTANSINIARLLPQIVYYFKAVSQFKEYDKLYISVPSGNFGNLCAGIIAKKMGLCIFKFIAATNVNDVVPHYLNTGEYLPKPSKRTLSNAMDVGDPSNFERILELYQHDYQAIKEDIIGLAFTDEQTKFKIKDMFQNQGYLLDPHGAVGLFALEEILKRFSCSLNIKGIALETAHPAKFKEDMEKIIGKNIEIPVRLKERLRLKEKSELLPNEYSKVKEYFLSICG
ncbi:MAG: threonine synthase [Thermotogaceae bacterium]|jgi:threonine synthase|nr:threonine synthase [Thermotogaceae bacterium]